MPHPPPQIAHMAAALIAVRAAFAMDALARADFVGGWALGSMGLAPGQGEGTVLVGYSLSDGSPAHVEILPAPSLGLIDYAVGSAAARRPRIFIRVTPGAVVGRGEHDRVVTLQVLRAAQASAER